MSTFATEVPALLLRLDRNPFHHGSLGAVRSLGRAGIEVHAFVESPRSPVSRSRHLFRAHAFPRGVASEDGLERVLSRVAEEIGRPAVLIPMDDLSAVAADRLADRLAGRFLLPAQPSGLAPMVADKAELAGLCERLGVPHPATVVPRSTSQAARAVRELGLPVVAKWSRPWVLPRGSGLRSTTLVTSWEEARRLYERSAEAGCRLLFQRLLPGGRGDDWFFHGCFGDDGRCLAGGAGRKELSWPVNAGLTATGSWLPNPAVTLLAHRLAQHVGYRGILDLDFRRDAAGGYHLLDFNPRPGAQFRLFTDRSGLDVVRALHLDLTGRPVPAARPLPGRVFVAENYAPVSWLLSAGSRPRPGGAPDARPVRQPGRWGGPGSRLETAWFAADDPVPFFAMAGNWLRRAGHKGLAAGGRPPRAPRFQRPDARPLTPTTTR
ncbi:ATP-grasp domain-containing protein [Streptomyces sp. ACA25]|uniref:carboxylate--amine ligase n=1 Tax=Streptomyces sp. ACA25 TaxID=3022596 RepID=UPI00230758C9|nr:ATP-grasp domain-containing protein [Streptomyces sp. ACA25]MDB1086304.1 ATP-grasp domain-containing protein [Streptomyces sp. ACA25]